MRTVLYTRQGCHLCDEAWQMLEGIRQQVELVDVDSDVALVQRYGDRVPVLLIDGRERMWGKFNRVLLRRLFQS